MKQVKCISCGKELSKGGVILKCPSCGKKTIVRCDHCRKVGVKYKCDCGFEGP
ncbi:MAG: RNA-binding protein [Candidatus Pacearchaeota archaeon]|nr:MAG: RNA-binding protein [Candidatus Pacearchaeota archaeon]